MGIYSEIDMEMKMGSGDDPFAEDTQRPLTSPYAAETPPPQPVAPAQTAVPPAPSVQTVPAASADPAPSGAGEQVETSAAVSEEDEDAKRKAHEEAEAKRKEEWEARQVRKKAEEEKKLAELAAMSDNEVTMAAMNKVGADAEKLTRHNMKECVTEHIQTLCLADPAFARLAQHPRKSMIHCFWYINRKAREFVEQEMKDNDIKPEGVYGVYGSDVPDDLCYQWAEDYFRDPDAKEDQQEEEEFLPKPYYGKTASKSSGKKAKKAEQKKVDKKPEPPKPPASDQITLGELGMLEASA